MIITTESGTRWAIGWDQPAGYPNTWHHDNAAAAIRWTPAQLRAAARRDERSFADLVARGVPRAELADLHHRAEMYRSMADHRPVLAALLRPVQPSLFEVTS
ncbi:hypothetical protein HJ590_12075 [Naumannella sp. ID2617S]|nr:hypothetical protein [Naumannella sp. ID2617S]